MLWWVLQHSVLSHLLGCQHPTQEFLVQVPAAPALTQPPADACWKAVGEAQELGPAICLGQAGRHQVPVCTPFEQ